jgi:beta-glucuronidase
MASDRGPVRSGLRRYRAQPLAGKNAFYENYKPQSKSELVDNDFDTSGHLNVPGDWNTQRESLLFYEGSVWYKRSFDYTKALKTRVFVLFGAANYPSEFGGDAQFGNHGDAETR